MVWAVNQRTHQSLSTSPSPQSLGHIKKRAHRVLLCHLISTNNQLRKTQGKPGRRGLKGRNPEVFCISSPEVRIRFFPSFSILPEYPSNDPLNPSPSLVLPPSNYLWNVSMLPFYHLIWNDHHLGVRLLPLCLHTASEQHRDYQATSLLKPFCLELRRHTYWGIPGCPLLFSLTLPPPHALDLVIMLLSHRLFLWCLY